MPYVTAHALLSAHEQGDMMPLMHCPSIIARADARLLHCESGAIGNQFRLRSEARVRSD